MNHEQLEQNMARYVVAPFAAAGLLLSSACSFGEEAPAPPAASSEAHPGADAEHGTGSGEGLADPDAKRRAFQVISSFENSTTEIQYGYAEDIGDGRGITAGRAGFTSGTGDLLMVVREYAVSQPDDRLASYLPALEAIDKGRVDYGSNPSTEGLDGFEAAWSEASARPDQLLNRAQDMVVDQEYFNPAQQRSAEAGVRSALGQLIILDTGIQHGIGDDRDGLPSILKETEDRYGVPSADVQEQRWLEGFLTVRQEHLEHAEDPDTREAWQESTSRVDALRSILEEGNMDLKPPLSWTVYGDSFTVGE